MLCKVTHCAWPILGLTQLHWGDWNCYLMQLGGWAYTESIMWHYYWYTTVFLQWPFLWRIQVIFCVIHHRQLRYTVLLQQLRIIWSCRQFDINLCLGSKFTCVAMVTCMQVLHRLHQCSCKEKLEVKSCGHGKFVITKAGKKMTLYARVRNSLHGPFHELLLNCKY